VTIEPRKAKNWLGFAYMLRQRGQLAEAQTAFETVLRLEPENDKALTALGQIASDQLRTEHAIDYLRRAINLDESNPEALTALANALQKSGQFEEAKTHYRRVAEVRELQNRLLLLEEQVALDPKRLETRFKIADILHQLGKPKERLAWLHSIVELAPHETRVFPLLVEHFSQLGDLTSARMYQQRHESFNEQRSAGLTPHEANP
jgi:tetratricopeptide (TPR) repeat protein